MCLSNIHRRVVTRPELHAVYNEVGTVTGADGVVVEQPDGGVAYGAGTQPQPGAAATATYPHQALQPHSRPVYPPGGVEMRTYPQTRSPVAAQPHPYPPAPEVQEIGVVACGEGPHAQPAPWQHGAAAVGPSSQASLGLTPPGQPAYLLGSLLVPQLSQASGVQTHSVAVPSSDRFTPPPVAADGSRLLIGDAPSSSA
jgi:hypothetical protein